MKKILQATSYKLQANINGFTLVELLVSVSIMIMLTGLFLANYHSANKRQNLIMAAQEMASNIRFAQGYALGSKEFSGSIPPGGWGVYFNETDSSYIIFADTDLPSGNQNYDGAGEKFNEISLPENVTISSVSAGSDVIIVFFPPDPITYINGADDINVQIEISDGETSKTVEVNYLGLVDVIN